MEGNTHRVCSKSQEIWGKCQRASLSIEVNKVIQQQWTTSTYVMRVQTPVTIRRTSQSLQVVVGGGRYRDGPVGG